jgi:hypothetical protein
VFQGSVVKTMLTLALPVACKHKICASFARHAISQRQDVRSWPADMYHIHAFAIQKFKDTGLSS